MLTNVTVRFMRRVQIADYEPAEAEVTLVASTAEVGAPVEYTETLLAKAKTMVLAALGKAAPVAESAEIGQKSEPAPAPAPAVARLEEAVQPVKRGPGRPRKHPLPTPAPAQAPAPAPTPAPTPAPVDEIDDEEPVEEAPAEEYPAPATIDEFRREVYAIAQSAGPEGAERIRRLRAEYGVAQVVQVPQEKWGEFLARARAACA